MRRLFSVAFIAFAVVVCALKIAEWTCENWWMDSLGYGGVQTQFWIWRIEAFVPAFVLWAAVMTSNSRLAWHNARWRDVSLPLLGPRALASRSSVSPEDRARFDSLARRGTQAFVILSALLCGMAASNQFDLWVLAFNPPPFKDDETQFLVALWPALIWVWNTFGLLLLMTSGLVISIAAFEGVLDFDTRGMRVGDATARHLAFCGAMILVWLGVRCGLAVLASPINFGWYANGISGYYDHSFTNPVRAFFLVSCVPFSLWFSSSVVKNAVRPLVGAVMWILGALFLPLMAPSFGRAVVRSSPALQATLRDEQRRHIQATQLGWGLEQVQTHALNIASSDFLPPTQNGNLTNALPGTLVWPQVALRSALSATDTGGGMNRLNTSDLFFERSGAGLNALIIDSKTADTQANSALELETNAARGGQVNSARREFQGVVLQSPIAPQESAPAPPPSGELPGEENPSVVAHVREFSFGEGEGVIRRNASIGLALALHFSDRSLLDAGPPITWHLDPLERVSTLAPFVDWTGAVPHPVWVTDSTKEDRKRRLYWLTEGCFTSRAFPGAAMLSIGDVWSGVNYARQSVLGVCDATTGDTKFYLFDPKEPFARVWNELLPGFFRSPNELQSELRAGTHISPILHNAQALIWARYHSAPDQTELWGTHKDEWRVHFLDSSAPSILSSPVVLQRGGRAQLNLITALAPYEGTVPSPGATKDSLPLSALLAAQDEGEVLWKNAGHAPLVQWVARGTVGLPFSGQPATTQFNTPFPGEVYTKVAIVPSLDKQGNCTGLSVSQGDAQFVRNPPNLSQWVLQTRTASTLVKTPLATPNITRTDPNLGRIRQLWRAWKDARSAGRWGRVEELERELNRVLTL